MMFTPSALASLTTWRSMLASDCATTRRTFGFFCAGFSLRSALKWVIFVRADVTRKHPHDDVVPDRREYRRTRVSRPHSHTHIQ